MKLADPPIIAPDVERDQVARATARLARPITGGNGRGRLEMKGIDKNFDGQVPAVRGIDLACEPGEFVVVVGPSGSGKSTLLNIAAGMIKPDAGTVTLDGHPTDGPGPDRAMVFQDHGLFPWLTAEQNIGFGLKMAGLGRAQPQQ